MKNKIIFILIMMLFLISTSCLAFTTDEAFELIKEFIPEYNGTNFFRNDIWSDEFDSFVMYSYKTSETSDTILTINFFKSFEEVATIDSDGSWYFYSDNAYTVSLRYSVSSGSWSVFQNTDIKLDSPQNLFFIGTPQRPQDVYSYSLLTNVDFYDEDKTEILFNANYGEEIRLPVLSSLNDLYTEKSESIDLTIYNNGTELEHSIVLKRFLIDTQEEDPDFGFLTIVYDKADRFYDADTDSWTLPLQLFNEFTFSDDYYYIVYLWCPDLDDPWVDDSGRFMVNFSDDFNPSSGSSYDITPTITAFPLSTSAQKTVTITSPVDNVVIYYKLGPDNPWQLYSSPITVTENCRVYALLHGIDGASATAQLDITNIADMTNFENRPNISPKINSRVEERNGDFYAVFYIPSEFLEEYDVSDWKLQWNINNSYWSDYPSGYDDRKGSARYYYEFTPEFPSVFSFRFVDENGFYSPSCTFTLNKNSNIPIVVGGTEGDAYDSNGNYDESNTDNNSMPSFIANAETPGEYVAAGTVYIVNLFSNIGGFFALVSSLFSFLPPIIIQILMTFLYVTFAIFVITIIKGIL